MKAKNQILFPPAGWLTVTEAAKKIGVTPGRVRQLIHAGQIPSTVAYGLVRLIREADVMAFRRRPVGNPNFVRKK